MDVPSLIGSKLGGYDIVRLLGRGGMGAVYEGHNPRINRRAAIKVLLPEFVGRADVVARFLNEARAVNSINHPGVVPVSEAENAADGSLYLVMEYVEGETLSARLARSGGQLSEPDVISICWQLADVLHAAHGKGIVHRDLKPGNVMLTGDSTAVSGERVKLLDFGIAKLSTDLHQQGEEVRTRTGQMLGTAGYMSPEQLSGSAQVGGASDVYSLGIMMFRMLAGRLPFTSQGGDVGLAAMHLFTEAPRLSSLCPGSSPWLDELIARMLAKNPAERPTLTEVRARLRQSVSSSSIPALPPPSMPELPTQSGPRPVSEISATGKIPPHQASTIRIGNVAPPDAVNSEPGSVTQATGQAGGREGLSARSRSLVLGAGALLIVAVLSGIALTSRPRGPGAGSPLSPPASGTAAAPEGAKASPEQNSAPPAETGAKAAGDSGKSTPAEAGRKAVNPATPERDKGRNGARLRSKNKPSRETTIID